MFYLRNDTQITIIGTPVETTDTFRATLSVIDSSEIVVEIAARQGPAGNVLGIVGSSLPQDTGLGQAIDTALASLSFTPPTANSQVSQTFQFLAGTDLSKAGNSSTFGSGINAPSLSSLDEEFYTFCSNGDYGYSMSSQTFFSSDAGGFSSEDSDQHQGRWEVVAGIAGEPYLFLQASDGRFFLNPVGIAEEIVIGSSVFSSASSDQCQ